MAIVVITAMTRIGTRIAPIHLRGIVLMSPGRCCCVVICFAHRFGIPCGRGHCYFLVGVVVACFVWCLIFRLLSCTLKHNETSDYEGIGERHM